MKKRFEINFSDKDKEAPTSPLPSPYVGNSGSRKTAEGLIDSPYIGPYGRQQGNSMLDDLSLGPPMVPLLMSTNGLLPPKKKHSLSSDDHDCGDDFSFLDSEAHESAGKLSVSFAVNSKKGSTDIGLDLESGHQQMDEATPLIPFFPRGASNISDGIDDDNQNDDDDDGNTDTGAYSIMEKFEEQIESIQEQTQDVIDTIQEHTQEVIENIQEVTTEAWEQYDDSRHYDWRDFWRGGGPLHFIRFIATGMSESAKQSDDELQENLNSLARMLSLLREYHDRFGMPDKGGPKDQEYVLREVCKDLYFGGAPIWALEPVMKKIAEGLTGKRGVDFFMLPRRVFIFAPSSGATSMFRIVRGYDMQRLDSMENVAVRLASFASNTSSVASVAARWPKPQELRRAFRTESVAGYHHTKEQLADEILTLASDAEGLFFFINAQKNSMRDTPRFEGPTTELGDFWDVEETTRELFSRLAAIDAATAIDKLDLERKPLYSHLMVTIFRVGSSAGACAFWFNGSWVDIFVSGVLAVVVAWVGTSPVLSKQERIIFEAVASLLVGLISGVIALQWPTHACFGAMAISGVLDMLQGFRVVYSIIEIMSRHTVTGGADFLEGVFFTTLIAYFLRFGQFLALHIMGTPDSNSYLQCTNGISEWWYIFFVPLAAISWSGLFNPHYVDLPLMALHGILGYIVSWQFYKAASSTNLNNFLAAMAVTFSAGIVSRFTGRQALGNTVAGIYVLLPGAYLVSSVYTDNIEGFLTSIILRAIIIGIGAWTGTILCSPTLLGINRGLMRHNSGMPALVAGSMHGSDSTRSISSMGSGVNFRRREKKKSSGKGGLLFF